MHNNMLAGLIAIIIVFIIGYIAYVTLPLYQAIERTKMLMQHAVPYEHHTGDAGMSILVAGDSTAVGTGASDPSQSIAGRIGADYPGADITNIGVNGLTLDGLDQKLQMLSDSAHYNLMVIQIGANDVTGFTSAKLVTSELQNALDLARMHADHVIVLTAGDVGSAPVFKFPLSTFFHYRTLMVRAIFMKEIAQYATTTPDVQYVDLYTSVPASVFNSDIAKYYGADHFHPSGEGYAVWYEYVRPYVIKALGAPINTSS